MKHFSLRSRKYFQHSFGRPILIIKNSTKSRTFRYLIYFRYWIFRKRQLKLKRKRKGKQTNGSEWLISTFFSYLTAVPKAHGEIHFFKNKLYKNNEAEIGKKKKNNFKNILTLGNLETKTWNNNDLCFLIIIIYKRIHLKPSKRSFYDIIRCSIGVCNFLLLKSSIGIFCIIVWSNFHH